MGEWRTRERVGSGELERGGEWRTREGWGSGLSGDYSEMGLVTEVERKKRKNYIKT